MLPSRPVQFRQTFDYVQSVTRRKSHERVISESSPIVTGSRNAYAAVRKLLPSGVSLTVRLAPTQTLRARLQVQGCGECHPFGPCRSVPTTPVFISC